MNVRVSPWLNRLTLREEGGRAAPVKRVTPYVVIGHGIAGRAAVQALLEAKPDAEVLVLDAGEAPQDFHPVGEGVVPTMFGARKRGPDVQYRWETTAETLDADAKVLTLSDGSTVHFGKCLLTVGQGPVLVPHNHVDRSVADR